MNEKKLKNLKNRKRKFFLLKIRIVNNLYERRISVKGRKKRQEKIFFSG